MSTSRFGSRTLAALALVALSACASGARRAPAPGVAARPASAAPGETGPGRTITPEAIAKMNVISAWDVVRRSGLMVSASNNKNGRAGGLRSRRGRSSLYLRESDTPLVVLDGVRTADFRVLESVPARTLLFVRYFTAIEATLTQGTDAGGGLIEVRTVSDP